jgi:hypothetical protein
MASLEGSGHLTLNSIVESTKDQVSSDIGGETILLSLQSAMYYGLDAVGSRIWELMQQPIRVSAIRDVIAQEYDVETAQCEADVIAFLREVAAKGLIAVSNDG